VNKEASHYVRLFGGNKIGKLIYFIWYLRLGMSELEVTTLQQISLPYDVKGAACDAVQRHSVEEALHSS
jgi:hypothetical protein